MRAFLFFGCTFVLMHASVPNGGLRVGAACSAVFMLSLQADTASVSIGADRYSYCNSQ